MKNDRIKSVSNYALCLFLLVTGSAQAAIVNFTISGNVEIAEPNNPFALLANSTISASGTYDDSVIGAGLSFIDFSTITNSMQITVGNTIFTDDMSTIPDNGLFFQDGMFDGLSYRSIQTNISFSSSGFADMIFNGGVPDSFDNTLIAESTYIKGKWDAASFEVTPVPVPAALWLFGSGLIFLSGISRRRKS